MSAGTKNKIAWFEKAGVIIGLIGGLIGIASGVFTVYDRFDQPKLDIIGVAPVAVWTKHQDTDAILQGISLILRIQNKGNKPAYFTGADIYGKVYLSYDEYWPLRRGNNYTGTNEGLESDFKKSKPFYLISWVGWISDQNVPLRIEPAEERFIKVTFSEPAQPLSVVMFDGSQSDYIGYEKNNAIAPKQINHNPASQWFFSFTSVNKSPRFLGIKDEVKNGSVKIEARFGTRSKLVEINIINEAKYITKAAWDETNPRKLYFDLR